MKSDYHSGSAKAIVCDLPMTISCRKRHGENVSKPKCFEVSLAHGF